MKKMRFHILLISFLLLNFNMFSQEKSSYFSDVKTNNSLENTSIIINSPANNSLISIEQISNANSLNSVVLKQIGRYNVSDISQSLQTRQNVTQLGNRNYYSFIDFYNSSPVNLNILQQGNSNSLQIYGSNSLINGMKIVQKSNFKNIIIKNYN